MSYSVLFSPIFSYVAHLAASHACGTDVTAIRLDMDRLVADADASGSALPEYPLARIAVTAWIAEKLPWYRPPEFRRQPKWGDFFPALERLLHGKGRKETIAPFLTVLRMGYTGGHAPNDPLLLSYRLRCENLLSSRQAGSTAPDGATSVSRQWLSALLWWLLPAVFAGAAYLLCRIRLDALYRAVLE